ncbi:MAG: methyltransferase domain-containing protein [Saprospirales bacterium]|nr:methyltransferase domain-containing protein [Saprospirales bacterium]
MKEKLPASLQFIANALESLVISTPASIRKIVQEAGVQPQDLEAWADFDHPVADSYGRKLAYDGGHFEIMAMSWKPGDVSAIHDHGYTQWGAVQVFGPAEHATFLIDDGLIHTWSRGVLKPYQVIAVSHELVHQMGNTSDKPFFTLHVYGMDHEVSNVTANARVFDLLENKTQRVDGGVFYNLPPGSIKQFEDGPRGDFPTRLRQLVELARRLQKMKAAGLEGSAEKLENVAELIFSATQHGPFFYYLDQITDESFHQTDSAAWSIINWELKEASKFQDQWLKDQRGADPFHQYAEWYDSLIGKPCLDGFMAGYLRFFQEHYSLLLSRQQVLSLGSGTGLTEEFMIRELGVPYKQLLGIDVSDAMLEVGGRRIQVRKGDVLELDPKDGTWDLAFSGLNVFHYLDHNRLEEAIQRTAGIVRPGGYFLGDFITPDHIRWYPNLVYADDQQTLSLRNPTLIEQEGHIFQESEIINVRFQEGKMRVSYSGKHRRFLPPLHRVRGYFENAFGGKVDLYDAVTLAPIPETADSCVSTRYIVVAQRK